MGMSLANDRLFVKAISTNLTKSDLIDKNGAPVSGSVPTVAYLPPFAGITDREGRLTPAMRERLIGQGLSGGVVRNVLFDMHERNQRERTRLKNGRSKIKKADLKALQETDQWEILTATMQEMFGTDIKIVPFNERYHSYLKVECVKGVLDPTSRNFKKHTSYNARDLMVEGQGFLQWLSVYALVLSPDVNVILLDEPDAHLTAALQKELLQSLEKISKGHSKQILMATHSPELIRLHDHGQILAVEKRKAKYLSEPEGRIKVLSGIGTTHTPTIHELIHHKRILILEAPSDLRFLKILAERANFQWPKNVIPWFWTGHAPERAQLFKQLKNEIPDLRGISIRDRDDESNNTVGADLIDKAYTNNQKEFTVMKWRRRHIENYLLCKKAIARAAKVSISDIDTFFSKESIALAVPENTSPSDVAQAIRDAYGKDLITSGDSIKSKFQITREEIAAAMEPDEIAEDILTFFEAIENLSK